MNLKTLLAATALTSVGAMASAQDVGDVTVGTGLSTFGLNLEGAYQIDPQLRARGVFMGGLGLEFEDTEDGDTVEGDFNLGGLAALADYYPLNNGWRVSGGLFLSTTELDASGSVDGDAASVKAEFANTIAPMVTTGYDLGFGNGWALTSEIGMIFVGGLDIEYTADDPADQAAIDADPDVQDAISDGEDLQVVPYIALGVSYQF